LISYMVPVSAVFWQEVTAQKKGKMHVENKIAQTIRFIKHTSLKTFSGYSMTDRWEIYLIKKVGFSLFL